MPGIAVPRCRSARPISAVSSSATRAVDLAGRVAQVQPQVGRHLVVAAAPGAQLAAERPDPFEQAPLERGVHVLVVDRGPERPVAHRRLEVVQGAEHRAQLGVRPAVRRRAGPGRAPARPPGRRSPAASRSARSPTGRPARRWGRRRTARPKAGSVRRSAGRSRLDLPPPRCRSPRRSTTQGLAQLRTACTPCPETVDHVYVVDGRGSVLGVPATRWSRRAAILLGRPQSSTKPLARVWSKTSPES